MFSLYIQRVENNAFSSAKIGSLLFLLYIFCWNAAGKVNVLIAHNLFINTINLMRISECFYYFSE